MKKKDWSLFAVVAVALLSLAGCSQTAVTTGSLRVVNNYALAIYRLYIAPTTSSTWGTDQLGSSVVSPGSTFTIQNIPAGTYDLKAVFSNSGYLTRFGVSIPAGETIVWTFSSRALSDGPTEELRE